MLHSQSSLTSTVPGVLQTPMGMDPQNKAPVTISLSLSSLATLPQTRPQQLPIGCKSQNQQGEKVRRKPVVVMADGHIMDFPRQNNGSELVLPPWLHKGTAALAHGLCLMKLS